MSFCELLWMLRDFRAVPDLLSRDELLGLWKTVSAARGAGGAAAKDNDHAGLTEHLSLDLGFAEFVDMPTRVALQPNLPC